MKGKTESLSSFFEDFFVKKISSIFDELDFKRNSQKKDIDEVEKAIFMQNEGSFQMPDIFELYQTFKSYIWENLYSNTELMFDVKGENKESDKLAPLQKKNLVNYFEKAKLQNILDEAIDFLLRKSEAIVFVGWKTKEKQIRRKINVQEFDKNNLPTGKITQEIVVQTKKVYDGLDLRAIDPVNLVFEPDNKSFYIYQTFVSQSELVSLNSYNFLDKAKKDDIIKFLASKEAKSNKGVLDDKIELLEYWGDIKNERGEIEKNQVIVVAARKFVIRKEENPYIINPFVVMSILNNPETKRGYLYLKSALPMRDKSQQIFLNQLRALEFITNPAYLAPKGAFSGTIQEAEPGKILEYEPALMPQTPVPLNMSGALQGWDFLKYLKSIEESTTGIYKLQDSSINTNKTATEVQVNLGGQNARLAMVIDCLNQNLIIPVIEKSAELISNLVFENEKLFVKNENEEKVIEINNNIRNADYKYIYGDRNSLQVRKFKAKEMFDVFAKLFNIFPEIKNNIDAREAFRFILEQYGFDNFERFKKDELFEKTDKSGDISHLYNG